MGRRIRGYRDIRLEVHRLLIAFSYYFSYVLAVPVYLAYVVYRWVRK